MIVDVLVPLLESSLLSAPDVALADAEDEIGLVTVDKTVTVSPCALVDKLEYTEIFGDGVGVGDLSVGVPCVGVEASLDV